jgi:hypothetical protein
MKLKTYLHILCYTPDRLDKNWHICEKPGKWPKKPVDKSVDKSRFSVDKSRFSVDKSVDKMWITFWPKSYPQVFRLIHRLSTGLSTEIEHCRLLINNKKQKVIHRKGLPLLLLSL